MMEEEHEYQQGMQQQVISEEFSKWQLWGEDILEQLKHDLRGEVFDINKGPSGSWYLPKVNVIKTEIDKETGKEKVVTKEENVKPLVNEQGITVITSLIRSVACNKFTLLSNLKGEVIYKILLEIANEITLLMLKEHKNWEIESPTHASFIISKIFYFMHNALLMAEDGKMRDYLGKQVTELRQIGRKEEKGKGFFGLFRRDKGG